MVVECGADLIAIDCGLMFPDAEMLGVDLVIPDVSWLTERQDRLRGIVITHGHEDHIGALPYLLPMLQAPVYGTGLALGFLRNKLREHRLLDSTELHTVQPGDTVALGNLRVEWIHTTHSIPDSCALAVHTPCGVVVHSGDFKIDETPIHGEPPDLGRLRALGDAGVLLLLSDSTNAESSGHTPSERTVGSALHPLVEQATGRVLIATFASNISRLQQAISISEEHHRHCFVVGRSMLNNVKVAQELGLLSVRPETFVSPKQAAEVADKSLTILCTGAQGEPLSALSRIAAGEHHLVIVHDGDTVILSANPIPGNESAVNRTVNNLYRSDVSVFHGSRHGVHASGHGSAEELRTLLEVVRPKYFMPVHGERRHLTAHAQIAKSAGIAPENIVKCQNGDVIEIDDTGIYRQGDSVAAGYVYVDGLATEDASDVVFRDRRQLSQDGLIVVLLTVERSPGAVVAGPELVSRGFIDSVPDADLFEQAREELEHSLRHISPEAGWDVWKGSVHDELTRFLYKRTKRRPLVLPLVTEV